MLKELAYFGRAHTAHVCAILNAIQSTRVSSGRNQFHSHSTKNQNRKEKQKIVDSYACHMCVCVFYAMHIFRIWGYTTNVRWVSKNRKINIPRVKVIKWPLSDCVCAKESRRENWWFFEFRFGENSHFFSNEQINMSPSSLQVRQDSRSSKNMSLQSTQWRL